MLHTVSAAGEKYRITEVGRAISLKVSSPNCAERRANFKVGPGRGDINNNHFYLLSVGKTENKHFYVD